MDWVVIVDDDKQARARACSVLENEGMKVTQLSSGEELLNYIEGMVPLPDLILMDVVMTGINGFETFERLREKNGGESGIPVIFLTGEDDLRTEHKGLEMGAVDFIRKPFFPEILLLRVKRTIEFTRLHNDLAREVEKMTRDNTRLILHVVQTLAEAIDAKDTYTNGHSGRVATYSKEIARRMGYDEQMQDEVYMMGLLHDVGKIGVPDWIINKTERLSDEEFAEIKKHPVVGNRILSNIREMPRLSYGARWHHERIDGRGYPDGIKGSEIPEEARIIAVADAYDAMTSNRSYRSIMPQEKVRSEIEKGKDKQFDARIAEIMLSMIDEDKKYIMREGIPENLKLREDSFIEAIGHVDKQPVLPDEIVSSGEFDTDIGVFLCGGIEDYLEALSIFAESVTAKSEKIESAFKNDETEIYTALVHSLKSSARTVGASDISELAAKLEAAAKSGDTDGIKRDTPLLLERYKALGELLKNVDLDV